MSVTGRSYSSTRPRGLAPWKPQTQTMVLVGQVQAVLDEYVDYLPLTCRQIFYRLVGVHRYDKTERAYERLTEMLNRARRSGVIAFDSIRDDGTTAVRPNVFSGMTGFWRAVEGTAQEYRLDPLPDQIYNVEVWVEAAGMVPQAVAVADAYGVPVFSSGGFDSVTAKHEAAERFVGGRVPTIVLHVGDHDPSGCSIIDSASDDIDTFCSDYGMPDIVEWRRVAVVPEQIDRFGLPTAPQKSQDRRGEQMDATVQCEALPPDVLAAEIRGAIEDCFDLEVLEETRNRSDSERQQILDTLREQRET